VAPFGGRFTAPTLAHRDAARRGHPRHQWRTPDRQTAEIHIRISLMKRFNAPGTAEIVRVA
jgi:hypothetical protein